MDENWNIIPILPDSKRPAIKWKTYLNKQYPKEELVKHNGNRAVICGKTSGNLIIFDLDYKDNNKKYFVQIFSEFIDSYPKLAKTYITETPHGHHFYYYIKDKCPTRSPRQDTEKSTVLKHLANKRNPTLTKVTNFPKLLKGVDILGQNGYALVPPSKVDNRFYKPMNKLPIKIISYPVYEKIKHFFLRKEPLKKRLRQPFFNVLVGNTDIEEQCQLAGKDEFLYWKYLFLEAYHRLELSPADVISIIKDTQKASFRMEETLTQLQFLDLEKMPMTNEKLKELFPSEEIIQKERSMKADEPLYVTIGSYLLSKYNIVTMDDSEEMLVRRGNVFFSDLNDFYAEMADEIVSYNKSITHLANSIIRWIKMKTRFSRSNLCFDTWLINFANGYWDIKTSTFYPNDEFKDKLFCYEIPHNFPTDEIKRAEICEKELEREYHHCPKFKKLLEEWLGKDNKVKPEDIFEMIGYSMTMNTDMKLAFFIYGPSHAGKTQFQTVLEHVVGHKNRANTSLQRMSKNEFGTHGLTFKVLNMVGDMSYLEIKDVSQFKTLTGGDEFVSAEIKGGKRYQFKNICKIWYNGNRVPTLEQDDQAFYNRWILIEFPNQFEMFDKDTVKSIGKMIGEDEDEINGIICEALKGVKRLMGRKWFRRQILRNTKHVWKYNAEPLYAFLSDKTVYDEEDWLECTEVRVELNKYFNKNGLKPLSAYALNQQLERYSIYRYRRPDGDREYVYSGIKWKPPPKQLKLE